MKTDFSAEDVKKGIEWHLDNEKSHPVAFGTLTHQLTFHHSRAHGHIYYQVLNNNIAKEHTQPTREVLDNILKGTRATQTLIQHATSDDLDTYIQEYLTGITRYQHAHSIAREIGTPTMDFAATALEVGQFAQNLQWAKTHDLRIQGALEFELTHLATRRLQDKIHISRGVPRLISDHPLTQQYLIPLIKQVDTPVHITTTVLPPKNHLKPVSEQNPGYVEITLISEKPFTHIDYKFRKHTTLEINNNIATIKTPYCSEQNQYLFCPGLTQSNQDIQKNT
jgi:hypothetical protein